MFDNMFEGFTDLLGLSGDEEGIKIPKTFEEIKEQSIQLLKDEVAACDNDDTLIRHSALLTSKVGEIESITVTNQEELNRIIKSIPPIPEGATITRSQELKDLIESV